MAPGCRVVGVEPAAADDATRSFRTRTLHRVDNPVTIADGARTPSLGAITFPLVLAHASAMTVVNDEMLLRAMFYVWERLKLVVEPTGGKDDVGALIGLAGYAAAFAVCALFPLVAIPLVPVESDPLNSDPTAS